MREKPTPPGKRQPPEIRAIQNAIIQWSGDHDGQRVNARIIGQLAEAIGKACPGATFKMLLRALETLNERRHEN